jgi:hypothetical protein
MGRYLIYILIIFVFVLLLLTILGLLGLSRSFSTPEQTTTDSTKVKFFGPNLVGEFPKRVTAIAESEFAGIHFLNLLDTDNSTDDKCTSDYYSDTIVRCSNFISGYFGSSSTIEQTVKQVKNALVSAQWDTRFLSNDDMATAIDDFHNRLESSIISSKTNSGVEMEAIASFYPPSYSVPSTDADFQVVQHIKELYAKHPEFNVIYEIQINTDKVSKGAFGS